MTAMTAMTAVPDPNPYTRIESEVGIAVIGIIAVMPGERSTPCDPHSKPIRPGQPSPKRDTDCRCFDVAEVCEVLEISADAVQAFIRAGLLPVVELGCRRLVTAGAVLAFVPERRRQEVRARLDEVERRRGGQHG